MNVMFSRNDVGASLRWVRRSVCVTRRVALVLLLALFALLGILLLSGCATSRRMVVPPVNPDMAPVVEPVKRAAAASGAAAVRTGAARESVSRAVQIVEKLVVAPEAVAEVRALKLELATTERELALASAELETIRAALDQAILSSESLKRQIHELQDWGLRVAEEAANFHKKLIAADEAIWRRNKVIVLQGLVILGLLAWVFKGPVISLARKFVIGN